MKKSLTTFFSGFILYSAASFSVARYPLLYHHRLASILVALALLAFLWFLNRQTDKTSLKAISKVLYFLAGGILSFLLIFASGQWRLVQAREAMSAAGYHLTLPANDVIDHSEKNGKIILDRLADDESYKKTWAIKKDGRRLGEDIKAALQLAQGDANANPNAYKHLKAWSKELDAISKVVDKAQAAPMFSWNVRYDDGSNFLSEIPHWGHLGDCMRVLIAQALLLADEGKDAKAETKLIQALWLPKMLRQNHSMVFSVLSAWSEETVLKGANAIFKKGAGASLVKSIEPSEAENVVKKSLEFHFLVAPETLCRTSQKQAIQWFLENPFRNTPEPWVIFSYPWLAWDTAATLEQNVNRSKCFSDAPIEAASCMDEKAEVGIGNGWQFQMIGFYRIKSTYLRGVICTARERMATLAYLAGRYKKIHGHWPKSLGLLGPQADVVDPFTGRPFIMRLKSGRLELTCVGADGVEDGNKIKEGLDKDIVIRL